MNKENLLKLADMLEADAANPTGLKFDLGVIVELDTLPVSADYKIPMSCGTSACAMGLAMLSGQFEKLGYIIRRLQDEVDIAEIDPTWDGKIVTFVHAAKQLFEITDEQAVWMFSPDYYDRTPQGAEGELRVAQRIRGLVKHGDVYDDND